jgi:hypothetical protein
LICLALLTLAGVAPVFRSSHPPRWATRGWIGEVVSLVIVCLLALGLGYLGAGAMGAAQTGVDYLDLGLFVVVVAGSVVIWRRLSASRPRAVESDVVARAHVPASGQSGGAAAGPAAVSARELPSPHKAA